MTILNFPGYDVGKETGFRTIPSFEDGYTCAKLGFGYLPIKTTGRGKPLVEIYSTPDGDTIISGGVPIGTDALGNVGYIMM